MCPFRLYRAGKPLCNVFFPVPNITVSFLFLLFFRLEISLSKAESGVVWPELIVGSKQGEEIMDPAFVEEVHQRLAHLCSETLDTSANGNFIATTAFNCEPIGIEK